MEEQAHEIKHESAVSSRSSMQWLFKKKFILIFVALVLILGGLIAYKQMQLKSAPKKVTVTKQVIQRRSTDLGYIKRGLTGRAIDVNTGKIVKAARVFSADDKTVYLQLDFYSAPKGTVIDYIRYKNGRYVDHGEITLSKPDTQYVLFDWVINNLLTNVRNGKWRVATYTNGILSKRINYEVTNNKVSYVAPDSEVSPQDPDYLLAAALYQNK